MSGRNSFTTEVAALAPIVMPKLTAASPALLWLGGSHNRATKAPAATPPSCAAEMYCLPLSCRASTELAIEYFSRGQKRCWPEPKYRVSSWKDDDIRKLTVF